jgi:hypothetical protein
VAAVQRPAAGLYPQAGSRPGRRRGFAARHFLARPPQPVLPGAVKLPGMLDVPGDPPGKGRPDPRQTRLASVRDGATLHLPARAQVGHGVLPERSQVCGGRVAPTGWHARWGAPARSPLPPRHRRGDPVPARQRCPPAPCDRHSDTRSGQARVAPIPVRRASPPCGTGATLHLPTRAQIGYHVLPERSQVCGGRVAPTGWHARWGATVGAIPFPPGSGVRRPRAIDIQPRGLARQGSPRFSVRRASPPCGTVRHARWGAPSHPHPSRATVGAIPFPPGGGVRRPRAIDIQPRRLAGQGSPQSPSDAPRLRAVRVGMRDGVL